MDINQFEKYIERKSKIKHDPGFWDKKAKAFSKSINNIKEYRDDFLFDFLEDKNILFPGISVADIGCAIGRHSVEFNKKAASYTGIDSSSEMIKICNTNKETYSLDNCTFYQTDWKEYDKKFDLVFASMFPDITTIEDVKRFIDLSNEHCLFKRIIKKENELSLIIDESNKNFAHNNPDYVYGLINIIWKLGYIPEVVSSHSVKNEKIEYEEALSLHSESLNNMAEAERDIVLKKLGSKAKDNVIEYKETVTKLIIYFNKKISL